MHIYTFDKKDTQRYRFRFINQVYRKPKNHHTAASCPIEWDIFYIGIDKYRTSILEQLKLLFDEQGISYNINIKRDKHTQESKFLRSCYINKSIDYETTLSIIEKSKCILEIIQNGQGGMTLRTLEAIFCDKKLITNNKDIINHPIYNPNNIYVIGNQENRSIKEFLETPQMKLSNEIKNPYEITYWINAFK